VSNSLTIEVVKTVDPRATGDVQDVPGEITWLAYDDYASQYGSYVHKTMEEFLLEFPTPEDLVAIVLAHEAFEDIGCVLEDGTIVLDTANSVEIHGYLPDNEVFVHVRVDSEE